MANLVELFNRIKSLVSLLIDCPIYKKICALRLSDNKCPYLYLDTQTSLVHFWYILMNEKSTVVSHLPR